MKENKSTPAIKQKKGKSVVSFCGKNAAANKEKVDKKVKESAKTPEVNDV